MISEGGGWLAMSNKSMWCTKLAMPISTRVSRQRPLHTHDAAPPKTEGPWMRACEGDSREDVVDLLLAHGDDANARNKVRFR